MSKTEFLFLSEPDLIEAGVLDATACINVCEEVFGLIDEGDYLMGGPNHNEHGLVIEFPKTTPFKNMPVAGPERRFIAMPAYLGGRYAICGDKWYGSNVENPISRGLPRSVLTVTLNDPESCAPIAYMSGNLISAMRTGCIPGVAVRYMANQDAETVSVVGVGPIQKATLLALKSELKGIKRVVANAAHIESAQKFVRWTKETLGLEGEAVGTMQEAVQAGDVVSIAASPKEPLFVKDEWFREGATALLISPLEADDDFWLNNKIIYDNTKMHEAYYDGGDKLGDVKKACNGWGKMYHLIEQGRMTSLQDSVSLGQVVRRKMHGRLAKEEKQIFVTSGQVLFDIAWGYELYQKAKEKEIGQTLTMWEDPFWL